MTTSAEQARAALGIRLRDIRRNAGLTGTELADRAGRGWLPSKVSKIEHGRQTPAEEDLRAWCEHCHASGELPGLITAVRRIETQFAEWRRIPRAGTRRRQQDRAAVHQSARMFRIYEPFVLPGLLQTREYANAVLLTVADFTRVPQHTDARVGERMDRQRILTDRDRSFHILLDEHALLTSVGGAKVMTAQLEHLLAASAMPRLRLGIIPVGAPYRVPPSGGFWIMDNALVEIETYAAELSLARPEEIDLYGRAFERLAALAVYGAETRKTITAELGRLKIRKPRPLRRAPPDSGRNQGCGTRPLDGSAWET